jgi:hypothetical protein
MKLDLTLGKTVTAGTELDTLNLLECETDHQARVVEVWFHRGPTVLRRDGWTAALEQRFEDTCRIGEKTKTAKPFSTGFRRLLLLLQLPFLRILKNPQIVFHQ